MAKAPIVNLVLRSKYAKDKIKTIKIAVYPAGSRNAKLKNTKHQIEAKYWDEAKQEVKNTYSGAYPDFRTINREIANEKKAIEKLFADDLERGVTSFTAEHIAMRLKDNSGGDFIRFYRDYIDNLIATKTNKPASIAVWETEIGKIKEYAGERLDFKAIDAAFLNKYHAWLNGKGYESTTIFKKLKKLRQIIKMAVDNGLMDNKQVLGFKMIKYKKPETYYLTLEQVKEIENNLYAGKFDHNSNRRLVAAYFLIECYSGIRFSDWSKFKVEKMVDKESFKVGSTTKTQSPVYLDLSAFTSLKKILTYIQENKLIFNLTERSTNENLKVIGGLIGLDFDLTSHDGRRTFATILNAMGARLSFIARCLSVTERTAAGYVHNTKQADEFDLNVIKARGGF